MITNREVERIAFDYIESNIYTIVKTKYPYSKFDTVKQTLEIKHKREELTALLRLFCSTKGKLPDLDWKSINERTMNL